MGKTVKSQWDFGELFEPAALRRVITVTELTVTVRRLLEKELRQVWITGEISNLRVHPSGHAYFTLKDSNAQLSCVLFRSEPVANRELLEDGRKVILHGDITVYEARGQYQLRVLGIELQGVGALQAAFERLKRKLDAEGLFAQERKRPIPRYPHRIGLVTASNGAAIRDVLHVFQRRHAGLAVVLASCRVQGMGAAEEVACAIRLLNEWSQPPTFSDRRLDLILVTRGGGSLEDLWAFNEEVVARAIYESRLPVVSAIGHEIDFTISDFVADLRAATPSAAAEIITEGFFASRKHIAELAQDLRQLLHRSLTGHADNLAQLEQRLGRLHPRRLLAERWQQLDDLEVALQRCARRGVRAETVRLSGLQQRLLRLRPSLFLHQQRQILTDYQRRMQLAGGNHLKNLQSAFANVATKLRLLGPENILARGYSITTDAGSGKIIRSAAEVAAGQKLRTTLHAGKVISTAEGLEGIPS